MCIRDSDRAILSGTLETSQRDVVVELFWQQDSQYFGNATTDWFGEFEFEIDGLEDGQSYTVWARGYSDSDIAGRRYTESRSFNFVAESLQTYWFDELSLESDAAGSIGSASDGVTDVATLTGLVQHDGSPGNFEVHARLPGGRQYIVPLDDDSRFQVEDIDGDATTGFQRWEVRLRNTTCLLYTSPSPRDATLSRMPSSA